jgi:hypothetical protein
MRDNAFSSNVGFIPFTCSARKNTTFFLQQQAGANITVKVRRSAKIAIGLVLKRTRQLCFSYRTAAGNYWKIFWAAPPTGSAQVRSVNFGSKLVALVANWAGFADSAD